MKNALKLFISTLLILGMMSVSVPVMAEGETAEAVTQPPAPIEYQTKRPMGKRQLAMKFLMAMLGVGLSSIIIFVLLSSYNKFVYGSYTRVEPSEEDNNYKTPSNMKDAINSFLKKTK